MSQGQMSETVLRHLESRSAIAERMLAISGRRPNAAQTEFASSCLLHGRLFWDAANSAPLETKPLLLYYGAAAFAKALVIASRGCLPQDLSQAHGLSCKPGDGDLIENFTVKAQGNGLFQEFNDLAARLNRLNYVVDADPRVQVIPAATSAQLAALEMNLQDCFSRQPSIAETYALCTGRESNSLPLQFNHLAHNGSDWFSIRTDVRNNFETLDQLRLKVDDVRSRFPFMSGWCLGEANNAWGNTVLQFYNCTPRENELTLAMTGGQWPLSGPEVCFEPMATLPPLAGGWSHGYVAAIAPLDGHTVSEFSIMLAALLALSSLVRYHPHTWTACVHRRPMAGRTIDDSLLPVISEFLASVELSFPRFVAEALTQ